MNQEQGVYPQKKTTIRNQSQAFSTCPKKPSMKVQTLEHIIFDPTSAPLKMSSSTKQLHSISQKNGMRKLPQQKGVQPKNVSTHRVMKAQVKQRAPITLKKENVVPPKQQIISVSKVQGVCRGAGDQGALTCTNNTVRITFGRSKFKETDQQQVPPKKLKLNKQNTLESEFSAKGVTGVAVAKNKKEKLINLQKSVRMQQSIGTQKISKNKVQLIDGAFDNFKKGTTQTSSSVKNADQFENRFNLKKEEINQILSQTNLALENNAKFLRSKKLAMAYSRGQHQQSCQSQEVQQLSSPKGDSTILGQTSHELSNEEKDIQEIVQHIEERVTSAEKKHQSKVERNRFQMVAKNCQIQESEKNKSLNDINTSQRKKLLSRYNHKTTEPFFNQTSAQHGPNFSGSIDIASQELNMSGFSSNFSGPKVYVSPFSNSVGTNEIMSLKKKIEERDECIKGLVKKINQIEKSVNNLNKQAWSKGQKSLHIDRESLSPNQGETTTSGNGESGVSQVPTVKVEPDIEFYNEEPEEENHPQYLGKIDQIISDWNKKMVHFDKQHFEIKVNRTKIEKKKKYNMPSSRMGSIIDDYNSSQQFTVKRSCESPLTPTDKLLESISPNEEITKKQRLFFAQNFSKKRDSFDIDQDSTKYRKRQNLFSDDQDSWGMLF